jgi:hypothetical protein
LTADIAAAHIVIQPETADIRQRAATLLMGRSKAFDMSLSPISSKPANFEFLRHVETLCRRLTKLMRQAKNRCSQLDGREPELANARDAIARRFPRPSSRV